jgi:hypothetical protein
MRSASFTGAIEMTCKHKNTTTGQHYGYSGSVATSTDEQNPAAHGGISYTLTCTDCGATRRVNENGRHVERGPWIARPAPVVTPWKVESYTVRRRGCAAWSSNIKTLADALNDRDDANRVCTTDHEAYAVESRTVNGVAETREVHVDDHDLPGYFN